MSRLSVVYSLVFLMLGIGVNAQNRTDTITVMEDIGVKFYQDGYRLNTSELFWITNQIPEMDDAKRTYRMGVLLSSIGGFLIGYPVGQHLGGNNEPVWECALVGVGITTLSLPIFTSSRKKAVKGVRAFNRNITHKKALD